MRPAAVLLFFITAAFPIMSFAAVAEKNFPEITANDNRLPRGHLSNGVLTIELEARIGTWYPEERDGPGLQVQAFAEAGPPAEIPGPLIRVPEGTEIQVSVRNTIPGAALVIHGLHTRPGSSDDTVQLAPG